MPKILVTGGAGYVGSHTVEQLIKNGFQVVVADNLSTGYRQAISPQARFYQGDVRSSSFLSNLFRQEKIDGVIHFASDSLVSESMRKPLKYFNDNLNEIINLLAQMRKYHVRNLVLSSSASVYGNPGRVPIKESDPTCPVNPYGDTKLAMERIVYWSSRAYGIRSIVFRYFNVAGASLDGHIGESHNPETHLIPLILRVALGQKRSLKIFGNDYQTIDGTNVRDYVHVLDLAQAHVLAIQYLLKNGRSGIFNLGSSSGFSNLQVLRTARKVTGAPIPARFGPRRLGDPDILVADSSKARRYLHWRPKYDNLTKIIQTAWRWTRKHPNGY